MRACVQLPDKDLGTSVTPGYRNITTDPDRAFGVPTIRRDISGPARPSVSDTRNFGSDADARMLLVPAKFADAGIDHRWVRLHRARESISLSFARVCVCDPCASAVRRDFIAQRDASEIRDVFAKIGHELTDDEFANVWDRAAHGYDLNEDGIVSVEEFRLALNEYLDARDEGALPEWWKS